jgi:hypothetical protein
MRNICILNLLSGLLSQAAETVKLLNTRNNHTGLHGGQTSAWKLHWSNPGIGLHKARKTTIRRAVSSVFRWFTSYDSGERAHRFLWHQVIQHPARSVYLEARLVIAIILKWSHKCPGVMGHLHKDNGLLLFVNIILMTFASYRDNAVLSPLIIQYIHNFFNIIHFGNFQAIYQGRFCSHSRARSYFLCCDPLKLYP